MPYFIPHHTIYEQQQQQQQKKKALTYELFLMQAPNTIRRNSLNSMLLNGGTVQQNLFSIVTRF